MLKGLAEIRTFNLMKYIIGYRLINLASMLIGFNSCVFFIKASLNGFSIINAFNALVSASGSYLDFWAQAWKWSHRMEIGSR
jgi:hypothetical protein